VVWLSSFLLCLQHFRRRAARVGGVWARYC
jgi:hypothetical protein